MISTTRHATAGQRKAAQALAGATLALTVWLQLTGLANAQEVTLTAPSEAQEGVAVEFAATLDLSRGVSQMSFAWDFGDGDTAVGPQVWHTYADDGVFDLCLTATDAAGQSFETTQSVVVVNLAPRVRAGALPGSKVEGTAVVFESQVDDVDDVSLVWHFGDGTSAQGTSPGHTYADDGTFEVEMVATDDDGAVGRTHFEVAVDNAPPVFGAPPATNATTTETYSATLVATDPSDDTLTYELLSGPQGMTLVGDTLLWVPELTGEFGVAVRAQDDDGAVALQAWTVHVIFADNDQDGCPDTCEARYGLDATDPGDAAADNDLDGLDNRSECLAGTDPTSFNGPTPPGLIGPPDGSRLEVDALTLRVSPAFDPDGDVLTYDFELFADAGLQDRLEAVSAVAPAQGEATWRPATELTENGRYWWRSRAHDAHSAGSWSAVSWFLVDRVNEVPTGVSAVAPSGRTDTPWPTLSIDPATDPDGDQVTYLYAVFTGEQVSGQPVVSGSTTEPHWTVPTRLHDNAPYTWTVTALDARGASGEPEAEHFLVDTQNDLPSSPDLLAPAPGEVLTGTNTVVEWDNAFDVDGDVLTYEVEIARTRDYSTVVYHRTDIPADVGGTTRVEVDALGEDGPVFARVRAWDADGAGQYEQVAFSVDAVNAAPALPSLRAPADSQRVSPGYVLLTHDNVRDPEGEDVHYSVSVFSDADLTEPVAEFLDDGDYGDTSVAAFEAPAESARYYWTVLAADDTGATSEVAGPWSFEVVVANLPPTAPRAVTPRGDINTVGDLTLWVLNSDDPEGEALEYTFEVRSADDRGSLLWSATVPEAPGGHTGVTFSPDDNTVKDFVWAAYATDARGEHSATSASTRFTLTHVLAISSGGGGCAVTPSHHTPLSFLSLLPAFGLILLLRRRNR